jgi:hypothetical protein
MRLLSLGSAVAVLLLVVPAGATTISLSDMSSEQEEGGTPPSVLTADVTFTVVGTTLTLDVNNTSNYDIVDLYFNSSANISGLSLNQPPTHPDWLLGGPETVGSLGTYDHHVTVSGNSNQSGATILDGTSASLEFSFVCGGICDMSDFTIDGDEGKALAAKFVHGGDAFGDPDDSAFGASPVPEPGTGALLGLGLVALARARRCC